MELSLLVCRFVAGGTCIRNLTFLIGGERFNQLRYQPEVIVIQVKIRSQHPLLFVKYFFG